MILHEDKDSWDSFITRQNKNRLLLQQQHEYEYEHEPNELGNHNDHHGRALSHHKHKRSKEERRKNKLKKLLADPGIQEDTMHGLMIDAGSTGSRMHVYEFNKRVLEGEREISEAVSGRKLTYPGTDTRWTDRLKPGLASFSTKSDEELLPAIAEYLRPLLEFAETVLHTKQNEWPQFPIYLKATAGLRLLEPQQRIRVMKAVRHVLQNTTYSSFKFEKEYARVISGNEEAIYGWAGVNFVLGSLLQSSEGSGTVINPKLTHGALEMGGASIQISFYQDQMDIMSDLFKLQIGQGKHWNVYAHSHLCFGIHEAWDRMGAILASTITTEAISQNNTNGEMTRQMVHNPCLAGGSQLEMESYSALDKAGNPKWRIDDSYNFSPMNMTMVNQNARGDYDACAQVAYSILNRQYNAWCDFSHRGDCSFSGVYQPQLPKQSENFGEFLAFSNYYHIWTFLKIPLRSSLNVLQDSTRKLCEMNADELKRWNNETLDEDTASQMCFRAAYTFQVLRNGYGFNMEDNITATNVVMGQKVGWSLGSMLYEINILPWKYIPRENVESYNKVVERNEFISYFVAALVGISLICFHIIFRSFHRRKHQYKREYKSQYSSINSIQETNGMTS